MVDIETYRRWGAKWRSLEKEQSEVYAKLFAGYPNEGALKSQLAALDKRINEALRRMHGRRIGDKK